MTTNYQVFNRKVTSDDFINLSEPPRPKDSPSISEFTTPEGTWRYDNRVPRPLHRRRSTNYIDALNLREMGKSNKSQMNTYEENKHYTPQYGHDHGYPTQKMEYQDTKHDLQHWEDYTVNSASTIDMGDHVQHQGDNSRRNICVPASPPQLFKSDYLDENDRNASLPCNDANKGYTTEGVAYPKPNIFRRRSSFEYEDFKKDIYDRLKFFEG
ncbi:inhibitor of glycogen debranching 1 [Monosporozyma unispora]|nr:hypothetical protein C6P44_002915 [Kazachstania unispora]